MHLQMHHLTVASIHKSIWLSQAWAEGEEVYVLCVAKDVPLAQATCLRATLFRGKSTLGLLAYTLSGQQFPLVFP